MQHLIRCMYFHLVSSVQQLPVECQCCLDCTLMAPHGGIFVFPVVGNAVMYLVSLVVGTVISAVLLGLLKKKVA